VEVKDVDIRRAALGDAEDLQRLCLQLGYEVEVSGVRASLREIEDDPSHEVFVATLDSQLVGWIELTSAQFLTSGPEAFVCGLVVDEAHRNKGIGKELLRAAEDWARGQGHPAIRVRSRDTRERAHKFYLDLGYETYKTQLVFRKWL
jgi:GNAT superfamily N-acetyltransferase